MDISGTAGRIGQSVLAAIVLVVIAAALYPYIPKSGPFGLRSLFKQAVTFAIPAVVIGGGAVAWQLLDDGGF
jgi:energy-converting hydrogenase Eha subunit A